MRCRHRNSNQCWRTIQELGIPTERKIQIIRALHKLGQATAREIKEYLNYGDMNAVRPRLTELRDDGVVVEVGTKDEAVGEKEISVAVFALNFEQTTLV